MSGWEAHTPGVLGQIVQPQGVSFLEQCSENALAVRRLGAEEGFFLGGEAGGDEVGQAAVFSQDAERGVPGVEERCQLVHDAREQGGLVIDGAAERRGGGVEALEWFGPLQRLVSTFSPRAVHRCAAVLRWTG